MKRETVYNPVIGLKFFICLISVSFLVFSCNLLSSKEKDIRGVLNEPLNLEVFEFVEKEDTTLLFKDFRELYQYISVVYLQDGCGSCYNQFIEWHQQMEDVEVEGDYTILFIIQGFSYEDFLKQVSVIDSIVPSYYAIMDPEFKFLDHNSEIPRWIIKKSMLIDMNNKVRMVGAPYRNEGLKEMFYGICM